MNKIIFCDKNKELLEKAKTVFGEVGTIDNIHCELIVDNSGDILKCKKKYPKAKIVTASNPDFSMGGGLDLILKNKYPEQCNALREFKITKDLFFVISVNKNLKATKKIIRRALLGVYFCSRKNDIILTGLGTGIGGISSEAFLEELALFTKAIFSNADFSNANFSDADFSDADFSRADFSRADFRWVDFSRANFSDADFSGAYFSRADFSRADFIGAYFSRADFSGAYFSRAGFSRADFSRADFIGAYFSGADFSRADFSRADFIGADFRWVDFSRANFSGADFSGADFIEADFIGVYFSGADFSGAKFDYRITPEEGSIIVWKKADNHIIKLKVDCKNISGGLVSRKLRTDKAKVLEIQNLDGTKSKLNLICSDYNKNVVYKVGKTVKVYNFVKNDMIECNTGIHFFLTRDEAVNY